MGFFNIIGYKNSLISMCNFYLIVYVLWLKVWVLDLVFYGIKFGFYLSFLNFMDFNFLFVK